MKYGLDILPSGWRGMPAFRFRLTLKSVYNIIKFNTFSLCNRPPLDFFQFNIMHLGNHHGLGKALVIAPMIIGCQSVLHAIGWGDNSEDPRG